MPARPSRPARRAVALARPRPRRRSVRKEALSTNLLQLVGQATELTDDDDETVDLICAVLQDHRAYVDGRRLVVRTDLAEAASLAALDGLNALDDDEVGRPALLGAELEQGLPGA